MINGLNKAAEVQRLLAMGGFPQVVVVDVGGLLRFAREKEWERGALLGPLVRASAQTHRRVIVFVAPPSFRQELVTSIDLRRAREDFAEAVGPDVIESHAPLAALLRRLDLPRSVGIVTALDPDAPSDLGLLALEGVSLLDVASGRVWTRSDVERAFCSPELLPLLLATTAPVTSVPLAKEAHRPGNREAIRPPLLWFSHHHDTPADPGIAF